MNNLQELAKQNRRLSLKAIHAAQSGHPGGCLSSADILTALFHGGIMGPSPYDFNNPNRDIFILSKGHSVPAFYSILYQLGRISYDDLMNLRQIGSKTQGHPCLSWLPDVVTSTGSLGQGIAFGVGLAMAIKPRRVFVLIGDGDLQEGITTEAARTAAHYRLKNLFVICDRNRKTSDEHSVDFVRDASVEFGGLGWWVGQCDGHSIGQIIDILERAKKHTTRPVFVECQTLKGKGVSFMETDKGGYHGSLKLSDEELKMALEELE